MRKGGARGGRRNPSPPTPLPRKRGEGRSARAALGGRRAEFEDFRFGGRDHLFGEFGD